MKWITYLNNVLRVITDILMMCVMYAIMTVVLLFFGMGLITLILWITGD